MAHLGISRRNSDSLIMGNFIFGSTVTIHDLNYVFCSFPLSSQLQRGVHFVRLTSRISYIVRTQPALEGVAVLGRRVAVQCQRNVVQLGLLISSTRASVQIVRNRIGLLNFRTLQCFADGGLIRGRVTNLFTGFFLIGCTVVTDRDVCVRTQCNVQVSIVHNIRIDFECDGTKFQVLAIFESIFVALVCNKLNVSQLVIVSSYNTADASRLVIQMLVMAQVQVKCLQICRTGGVVLQIYGSNHRVLCGHNVVCIAIRSIGIAVQSVVKLEIIRFHRRVRLGRSTGLLHGDGGSNRLCLCYNCCHSPVLNNLDIVNIDYIITWFSVGRYSYLDYTNIAYIHIVGCCLKP